jgi:16S rRNA (adenine1518-N6/adenine1519-N6)-dimethyltransferase
MRRVAHKGRAAPLGQHLLTNSAIAKRVAEEAGAGKGVSVYEVGPGRGMLTRELLLLGAKVVAVEKDPMMVEFLKNEFSPELKARSLKLICGDARQIPPDSVFPKGTYVIAANIPYYITGELIRTFLTSKNQPQSLALLVQKEVAERIARSKKESILSLSVKAYGAPHYVTTVKRGNFSPPPKVDSAILAVRNISRKKFTPVSEKKFFAVVKAGFGQKRKTLAGNLKRVFKKDFSEHMASLALPLNIRAEDVTLEKWIELAKKC